MAIQINVEFLFSHTSHLRFFTFIICRNGEQLKYTITMNR